MKYKRKILALLLMVLFSLSPYDTTTAQSTEEDWGPLHFAVNGNGNNFRLDRKTGRLEMPDCVVTGMYAYKTTWDIPQAYENADTAQRIFDIMLGSELVTLDGALTRSLEESALDPTLNVGLRVDFQSPKGASKPSGYQKKGQGYGKIWLKPMDAGAFEELKDLVEVNMVIYRRKGKKQFNFYVKSEELAHLLIAMSGQNDSLEDLSSAQSVAIYYRGSYLDFAAPAGIREGDEGQIAETGAVQQLVAFLQNGKRMDGRFKVSGEWLLRFSMPDKQTIAVRVADLEGAKPVPDEFVVALGEALYAVDREEFYQALKPANMRRVYRMQRIEKMARERIRENEHDKQ